MRFNRQSSRIGTAVVATVVAATVVACATVISPQRTPLPGTARPGMTPDRRPTDMPRRDTNSVARAPSMTVCVGRRVPSGYIATDYVLTESCGQVKDTSVLYNASYVIDIIKMQPGDRLVVCTAQPVPPDWGLTGESPAGGHCLRDKRNAGKRTLMEIVKLR